MRLTEMMVRHTAWVFDCDGVILDSNNIKTSAFFDVTKRYGEAAAWKMVAYHKANGGVSRFAKFDWFLRTALNTPFDQSEHRHLCEDYGRIVKQKLIDSNYTDGFTATIDALNRNGIKPYIASGGLESELRDVFSARGISGCFAGIFGSPRTKLQILEALANHGVKLNQGIFFGDARADFDAANSHGMQFVFVKRYADATEWFSAASSKAMEIDTLAEIIS